MNYNEAVAKLQRYGQEHLLKYYEELDAQEKEALLVQIESTDFNVIKAGRCPSPRGVITPLEIMTLDKIEASKQHLFEVGIKAIKAGKVGAVLLAGGMGTRLGSDEPKGMYDIGVTRQLYIFECIVNNLMDVVKQTDTWIQLFVMTSEKNNDDTIAFFKKHDFFGYNPEHVAFFVQDMAPTSDTNGKVFLEEKGRISTSPNGNGGWYLSMKKSGMLDIVKTRGIEWLNVFAVDNVLQRTADPVFVGAVIEGNFSAGCKVVRKINPEENIGVLCMEDGKPSIVEYYELTDDMRYEKNDRGEYIYNFGTILNFLFKESELANLLEKELPIHVVERKIPYIDENGNLVKPEQPNGYKYEQHINDMVHMIGSCLPFEVLREHEFAPIKNKEGIDSVETARELLRKNGVIL
ncbi:MAG: UTP--glucose-1-phosphate uridylyltransferase [Bacillota bacterium]|nr:UTP--glucose-1-phosphate uridylyltransferase [Bacillota bacterium]NLU54365.1 UDPGP type 1 family protein [Bacillota bacterium]HOA91417.1 UTP--glucose-1-phosphate uridylyltransferase [Bacillota bacterium]HPT61629.1 UTP--glucose-1-phosphate uridylyltransferase [Bacillota bacterium]HPZ73373.1 UTP--glucose-1-phosphate uridylyltransferase [Bacillota bacterium]